MNIEHRNRFGVPITAARMASYSFGRLLESYSYHGDGSLYQRLDPLGRATTYTDYWRGIAREVTHRDGQRESASVNNLGLLSSYTNQARTTTSYGYDSMGRLASVNYPAESTGGYHPTILSYAQVNTAEYGIPAGHWRQTVSMGNARTVRYYDALWRVGLTHRYDTTDQAGTSSLIENRYDVEGRKIFQSYPQRSLASLGGGAPGKTWWFDVLGRQVAERQDSELGPLDTVTEYLGGFQRRVTNPRGHATTFVFQAFDTPSESAINVIWAPEGVTLGILRDAFGKPLSITRSGSYAGSPVSATRQYAYDIYQRLCKTVEPETGATVQGYDDAGNVWWRASGQPSTSSCDQGSVPPAQMVSHGYDSEDRLTSTSYGDGSLGITRSYTADGLPQTTGSGGTLWALSYNNRRLMTSEAINLASGLYTFSYGIDSHGHTASMLYPGGMQLDYGPNALGQPTQVSGFAGGIRHHPDGQVAGYSAANGVAHGVIQNLRGLPAWWQHTGVVNDSYSYDANGNATAITDQHEGVSSRAMGYDGLDRLTAANGIWGTGSFGYDALDNIRSSTLGSRTLSHNVDPATNRLTSLSGSQSLGLAYDANGNITQRGSQGFGFDIGNRMRYASGKASYTYDGLGRRAWVAFSDGSAKLQMYGQDGRLLLSWQTGKGFTRHVYLGSKVIAESNDISGARWLHTDALGSPVATTGPSGALLSRTRYEPYGATASGTNPDGIGFTGHVNDSDTGLVYMQQRYYDPIAGRFLSVDPVTTSFSNASHFNRYNYANNNPYRFVDPDGRSPCTGSRIASSCAPGATKRSWVPGDGSLSDIT